MESEYKSRSDLLTEEESEPNLNDPAGVGTNSFTRSL